MVLVNVHVTRRPLAITVVLLAGLAAALVWWSRPGRPTPPEFVRTGDQNLLLVTIDTLRADALGSYGGAAQTPNLDRLAAEGLRFTFAHAHAVVTLPSHASILTGRYPFAHGVRDNAGFRLNDRAVTLAELARAQGFATGAFVGAFPLERRFGLAQGFDVYDDVGGREVAPADFGFTERPAAEVIRAAMAWIEQQSSRWLAWVHLFDPHSPYAPPPPFDREYSGNPYAGEVAHVDHALGPLLEAVRQGPRPTTIVVTADHGEGLGDHGEPTHGVFAYESTLRVPLIVAQVGPGDPTKPRHRPTAPFVSDAPVRHVDILPTLAELADLKVDSDLPGRTVLNASSTDAGRGPDFVDTDPRPSYFEAMTPMLKRGWAPLRGLLVGREKYIELPIVELYDLAVDSEETRNLAPTSAARVRDVAAELIRLGAALPGAAAEEQPEVRAKLQALGYLSGSAPRKARYSEDDDPKRLIDIDRLMNEGIELHRAGRGAEAIERYRQVIARRPDMGLAYRRLAFLQWEQGAFQAAIGTLRHALERNGPDVDIEIRLGMYLSETGKVRDALPMLERAAKARPEDSDALNALGIAYARSGRPDDARRAFEQILAIEPRDALALENLGTLHLERGDLGAAADAFGRAAANDPRSSRARAGLGVVAIRAGRRDEAIEHWRQAVALDPANFDALYNLGTELVNAGRPAEARPYLEQFARTAPRAFYARDIERINEWLRTKAPG